MASAHINISQQSGAFVTINVPTVTQQHPESTVTPGVHPMDVDEFITCIMIIESYSVISLLSVSFVRFLFIPLSSLILETTDFFYCLHSLPFPECHRVGIMQHS